MRDEMSLRRPGFRPGRQVRLADGRPWILPNPGAESTPQGSFGPDYEALLAAIGEAEDEEERLRAELALSIALLGANYRLDPGDYAALLEFRPGDPAAAAAQAAFREIADEHRRAAPPPANRVEPARRWAWGLLALPGRLLGRRSLPRRAC